MKSNITQQLRIRVQELDSSGVLYVFLSEFLIQCLFTDSKTLKMIRKVGPLVAGLRFVSFVQRNQASNLHAWVSHSTRQSLLINCTYCP